MMMFVRSNRFEHREIQSTADSRPPTVWKRVERHNQSSQQRSLCPANDLLNEITQYREKWSSQSRILAGCRTKRLLPAHLQGHTIVWRRSHSIGNWLVPAAGAALHRSIEHGRNELSVVICVSWQPRSSDARDRSRRPV